MLLRDWFNIYSGAVISFPPSLNRIDIINLLLSELTTDDKTIIVVDTSNIILSHINNADIVIFSDIAMSSLLSSIQPYKIIFLSTWGDTLRHLVNITDRFPNLPLLKLDIPSDPLKITWIETRIPLSNRQLFYYNKVRTEEMNAPPSNRVVPYPVTRMLTLYTYPDHIMRKTLTQGCYSTKSLFTPTSLDELRSNGPKLANILDEVVNNRSCKQIIITRFNRYYGVELIRQFLELIVDKSEIYSTSCSDSNICNTLTKFNEARTGILVTNIIPLIPINGDIIHIVDSYSFLTLRGFLRQIINNDICVYSYIATHPDELSADEILYNNLVGYVNEVNKIYSILINTATYNPENNLIVN